MKKGLLLIFLLCLFFAGSSFGQGWEWGRDLHSLGKSALTPQTRSCVSITDLNDNVYAAGLWKCDSLKIAGDIYYSRHIGIDDYETYLIKYDSRGNIKWSSASVVGQAFPLGMAADKLGNVYMYGCTWTDSVQFGSHLLINHHLDSCLPPWCGWGQGCYFIIKYDSVGNIIWAKTGDNVSNGGGGITVDDAGNLYVTGNYWNATMQIGPFTLHNSLHKKGEIFLAKYDAAGNELWAKNFGGPNDDAVAGISYADGRIYLTGGFNSPTLTFGSITLNYVKILPTDSLGNGCLVCMDTSGNARWGKSTVGCAAPKAIATDKIGGIYMRWHL